MRYFHNALQYPAEAATNRISGTVFISFTVRKTGKIDNISTLRGVNPFLDNEAIRVIEAMPDWIPGRKGGIAVSASFNIPILFRVNGINTNDEAVAEEFENTMNDELIHTLEIHEINRYIFSTCKLGWINVDMLLDNNNPRIRFLIALPYHHSTSLKLVLRDNQSILDAWWTGENKYGFDRIPTHLYGKIVALKYENERIFVATKDIQIRWGYFHKLSLQKYPWSD